jgi:alpha-L-fucosidase
MVRENRAPHRHFAQPVSAALALAMVSLALAMAGCTGTSTNSASPDYPLQPPAVPQGNESPPIESYYPVPSPSQLSWQDADMLMFVHFGINTFTDKELGDGTDSPALFNPTSLDAGQWVSVAKEIGFAYVILTAKHVDGFCLWPSRYTSYSIAHSPYKNGTGNIVKEFADACHASGVSFGFYCAPWDRHEPTYGTDAYNDFYRNQLTELVSQFGDVGEVWLDGANGDTAHKQVYNWDLFWTTIRSYQPQALIAVSGPDIRWVGNEYGVGNETEWSAQPEVFSMQPSAWGLVWWPAECDITIRPGWFYHADQDAQVKSVDSLTKIYFQTVGRNSNLLLNVPPNKQGLISDVDISRLRAWRQNLNQIFERDIFQGKSIVASSVRDSSGDYAAGNCLDGNRKTFWAANRDSTTAELIIDLAASEEINIVRLEEAIQYGQRIESFRLLYDNGTSWVQCFQGTTIGRSMIVTFEPVQTTRFKIVIDGSLAAPTLRIAKAFYSTLLPAGLNTQ